MQIIIERWYLGVIVAAVALLSCALDSEINSLRRVAERRLGNLDRIYSLARDGRFDDIRRSGLTTEATVKYLEMQDQCFGRIRSWMVDRSAPRDVAAWHMWDTEVSVDRPRANLAERVVGFGPEEIHIALYPTDSNLPDRGTVGDPEATLYGSSGSTVTGATIPRPKPIDSPGEAVAFARPILHSIIPLEQIKSVSGATRAGKFWVVQETIVTSSGRVTMLLVLSNKGELVERVAG